MARSTLRHFDEVHIDDDCTEFTGEHKNKLFYNCTFDNLNNLTLQNCDLNGSQFLTDDIRKALGFTVTMNCLSFSNVKLSPLLFDLLLLMLMKTTGNDDKREKLKDVVGRSKAEYLLSILKTLE